VQIFSFYIFTLGVMGTWSRWLWIGFDWVWEWRGEMYVQMIVGSGEWTDLVDRIGGGVELFPRCQGWRTVLVIDSSEVVVAGPWTVRTRIARIEFSRTTCGTLLVRSRDAVVAVGIWWKRWKLEFSRTSCGTLLGCYNFGCESGIEVGVLGTWKSE
jgi:hypothetical protein